MVLTARMVRDVAGARLEYNRGDHHGEANQNDLGAQQHRRLLGDEDEACRGDRANGTDQRLAGASGQMSV
jgi:hypothetical protein